jgi:hypothetical protein
MVHTLIISQVFSFNKRDIERFKYTEGGTAMLRADLSYPACLESNHTRSSVAMVVGWSLAQVTSIRLMP